MWKTMPFLIERSVIDMSRKTSTEKKPIIGETVKKLLHELVQLGVLSGILLAAFTFTVQNIVSDEIEDNSKTIKELFDEKLNGMSSQIDGINNRIGDMNERINGLEQDIRDIYKSSGLVFSKGLAPTDDFVSYASSSYSTLDGPIIENNAVFLTNKSVVAYSSKVNEEYTVEQVADERLLLPYVEDGQEVYFWGQLSESGNWDGNCIVNIYENDELQMITDALYDDGDLLTCKQIFLYTTTSDKIDVWGVSKRTAKNGFNSGETRYFVREENYTKEFTLETAQPEDIFSADAFEDSLTGYLEGFYSGNTSNGQFNDETSTAYMVKYFSDGTIKTLYVGNFHNGQFHDTTGNAWMVGTTAPGELYSYYCGPFTNGKASLDPKLWEDRISQERIEEIIQGYAFDCELNWGD